MAGSYPLGRAGWRKDLGDRQWAVADGRLPLDPRPVDQAGVEVDVFERRRQDAPRGREDPAGLDHRLLEVSGYLGQGRDEEVPEAVAGERRALTGRTDN